MVDNQDLMVENFRTAMMKLSNVGQDVSQLIDCSELIPEPLPATRNMATSVPLLTHNDS